MSKANEPKWYTVAVYTGKEDHVAKMIMQLAKDFKLEKKILETFVPRQKQVEFKGAKKVIKEKKMLPGYILVRMVLDNETVALVNSIEEVRGFVRVGGEITPVSPEEIERFKSGKSKDEEKVEYKTQFMINDAVRIIDGVFKGQIGKVVNIDEKNEKLTVVISMLGTEIPYEVHMGEVAKI